MNNFMISYYRAQPCQGWGREFESHRPLQIRGTFPAR